MALSPTQKQTLTELLSGSGPGIVFTRFDPALGTLTGVTLAVTTTVSGTVSLENLDLAPVELAAGLPVALAVISFIPGSFALLVTATATASGTATLAAFDGSNDFAGGSGTVLSGLSGTHTDTVSIPADDYPGNHFIGVGDVAVKARMNTSMGLRAGMSRPMLK